MTRREKNHETRESADERISQAQRFKNIFHSYQGASHTQKTVKEWAYDAPLDWLAGIGNNGDAIEVDGDKITIKINRGMKEEIRVYKLEATNAR